MDTPPADSGPDAASSEAIDTVDPSGPLTQAPEWERLRRRLSQTPIAESTRRVYRRHWNAFAGWCEESGRTALPATAGTVQDYATAQAARRLSLSTIRGRLAAVRYVHREDGRDDPTAADAVNNTLGNLSRHVGRPAKPKSALLREDIAGMVRALPGAEGSERPEGTPAGSSEALHLRGIRDRALILLGYAGALRRSELASLRVEHVTFNPEGCEIMIPRSKGDQEGRGQIVGIARGESPDLCPIRALRRWMDAAGLEGGTPDGEVPNGEVPGLVFRPVSHRGEIAGAAADPLSGQAVANVIKRAVDAAGLDAEAYSGHSLRRGHLTTAARAGAPLSELQRHARHKDPRTTAEYIEDANRMETTTSRHLGL